MVEVLSHSNVHLGAVGIVPITGDIILFASTKDIDHQSERPVLPMRIDQHADGTVIALTTPVTVEIQQAHARLDSGHKHGSIVVRVSEYDHQ